MIPSDLVRKCRAIIDAEAEKRMQSGNLPPQNLLHSTLLCLFPVFEGKSQASGHDERVALIGAGGRRREYRIVKGPPKGYIDFWKTWPSWKTAGVRKLLEDAGFQDETIASELMGTLYGGVCYGILTLIRSPDDHVLVGLRATKIAGEFGGFLSLPGGLVQADEALLDAAARQLREEVGEELSSKVTLDPNRIALGEHVSAPSFTFIVEGRYPDVPALPTHQSTGIDVLEWAKKGKLVWVPINLLRKAAQRNDAADIVEYFRQAGLNVNTGTQLAGDIVQPLRLLLQ